MRNLSELIQIEDDKQRFSLLKKAFMPYSRPVEVDGCEEDALTVLFNLSLGKPQCTDWLDNDRAKSYLSDSKNLLTAIDEIKWFHTHNLKYPDCRVKEQRIIAEPLDTLTSVLSSHSLSSSYGWAHNSAVYKHSIWLLNQFSWQGKTVNLLALLTEGNDFWETLVSQFGLSHSNLSQLKNMVKRNLPVSDFPREVSRHSKQVRFPWEDDYLSVTPVVSNAMQEELAFRARDIDSKLRFKTFTYPNAASIGNLCGSLGGNIDVLNYPLDVREDQNSTLAASRARTGRYFDDYQLTSERTLSVLGHLAGYEPLKTRKQRERSRHYPLKIIRKQIARWLLPLIELRDNLVYEPIGVQSNVDDELVTQFLNIDEQDFHLLTSAINQRINLALQSNKYSQRFAYHPKLMDVLKRQLQWVLAKLSAPLDPEPKLSETDEQFLYLRSMRVSDAIALSCPYLCGAPSLTAIWGFVHRYQRDFSALLSVDSEIELNSFSLFLRHEKTQSRAKLTEPSVLAQKRKISPVKRPTIITEQFSDIVFDLVIRVHSNERLSDHHDKLKVALPCQFAGGSLFQPELSSGVEWLTTFGRKNDLFQVIKGLPAYGFWLFPYDKQPTNFTEFEETLVSDRSLLPVSSGFHLLEKPNVRLHSLSSLHVYAENCIGIAKRTDPIEVRFSGRDHYFSNSFWSLQVTEQTILLEKQQE